MDAEDTKFLSRKFILTVLVMGMAGALPIAYRHIGVSDMVTMTVLCLLGAVGAAYGFMNIKDAKTELERAALGVSGGASDKTSK